MKLSTILAPLLAAKVDPEVILDAVRAWEAEQEAQEEEGREKARARWRKWKEGQPEANGSKRLQTTEPVSSPLVRERTRGENNLQPIEIAGEDKSLSLEAEFEKEFWPPYPRKAGKGQARKAFVAVRKRGIALDALLAGVKRYATERANEDPKFTQHASTWLNGEGWDDEPAPKYVPPRAAAPPGQKTMNDVLNEIQGKTDAAYPGPTIDASVNRADRGSAANLVQFDAAAARFRS
jgi:hypothetical protein